MIDGRVLCGWKEIESYLGLTRKTIERQGYPVGRRKAGCQPYADAVELARHAARLAQAGRHGGKVEVKRGARKRMRQCGVRCLWARSRAKKQIREEEREAGAG